MKLLVLLPIITYVTLAMAEPQVTGKFSPALYRNRTRKMLSKNVKQIDGLQHNTLVVQIRSDKGIPLVLKGGRTEAPHRPPNKLRGNGRPIKSSAPFHLKQVLNAHKSLRPHHNRHHHVLGPFQMPLKIKLNSDGMKTTPSYVTSFKYEKPSSVTYSEIQDLPFETNAKFLTEHLTPIHTIPAPIVSFHDHHDSYLDTSSEQSYLPLVTSTVIAPNLQQQPYHLSAHNDNAYLVEKENTNDHTVTDLLSGTQTLFAPDPDPSLRTTKLRQATESYNKPSNSQPLPADVSRPIANIVRTQPASASIPAQLQPLLQVQDIPIYNPTYLVTQSNNFYSQHKQQMFKPTTEMVATSYANSDLTQEVASDGQILQAAKDPLNNIHPVLDSAPQFAPLIAAPTLAREQHHDYKNVIALHLPNTVAAADAADSAFMVSNYYVDTAQDSSQLLQAYKGEIQAEQQLQQYQRPDIEHQHHFLDLNQQKQHQLNYNTPEALQSPQKQPLQYITASNAFHEHERLVHQQLGDNTSLRIFVPDDETTRL